MAIGRFNLSLTGVQPGGLVYVGGTTFSAASTVSLDNVFSSTYDNYKILIKGVTSGSTTIKLQLRVAGVNNSTASSYVYQLLRGNATAATAARTVDASFSLNYFDSTLKSSADITIFDPFLAEATSINCINARATSSAILDITSGTHNQTVSYDGFTIFTGAGTMTGTVKVYGYRNDNN